MEQWEQDLKSALKRSVRVVERYSSEVSHRRIQGQFGGTEDKEGFRAGILYMALSEDIDTDIIKQAVRMLKPYMYCGSSPGYSTLFMSKEDDQLLHPKGMFNGVHSVHNCIDEFYGDHDLGGKGQCKLKQLFPRISVYDRKRFPSNEDICIVFYGKEGIAIDEKILEYIDRNKNNWIWVYASKGEPVQVTFKEIPDTKHQEETEDAPSIQSQQIYEKAPDDFYLHKSTMDTWLGNKEVTIEGNGEVSFRNDSKKVSLEKIAMLWTRLQELRVFQLKKEYSISAMDGEYWKLFVKGGGHSVESSGHLAYPSQWKEINKAIDECIE